MTPHFTRKADAIRAAKRIGFRHVFYRRTGARLGLYTIGNVNHGLDVVWSAS